MGDVSFFLVFLAIVLIGATALIGTDLGAGICGGNAPARPHRLFDDGFDEPVASLPPVLLPAEAKPADVDHVRFALGLRGYRMDQVDQVLDDLRDQLASKDAEIAGLREQLRRRPPASTTDAAEQRGSVKAGSVNGRCGNAGPAAPERAAWQRSSLDRCCLQSRPPSPPRTAVNERRPDPRRRPVVCGWTIALRTAAARLRRPPGPLAVVGPGGGGLCWPPGWSAPASSCRPRCTRASTPGSRPSPTTGTSSTSGTRAGTAVMPAATRQRTAGGRRPATCRKTPGRSIRCSRRWGGCSRPPRA